MLASLDVESLFTNAGVTETIDTICKKAYKHPDIPSSKIPRKCSKTLLEICTAKTSCLSPNSDIKQQVDEVRMGTPLGPTFANFYASLLGRMFSKMIRP